MKKNLLLLLTSILFSFTGFSQTPINLQVDTTLSNSASLVWDNGSCAQNDFVLSYKDSSLTSWDSIVISNNGVVNQVQNILSLNSQTTYNWRVKCDTIWVNGPNFTTSSCFIFYHNVTNASCDGNQDGAIISSLSGGFPPYSYNWSSSTYPSFSETTENIDTLFSGSYILSVTDSVGCTQLDSVIVATIDSNSINQITSDFSINPVETNGIWTYTSLSLVNTGCDVNLRPEFLITLDSALITQGDLVLQWLNPITGQYANLTYNINSNGDAYGFWHFTSNGSNPDSSGLIVNEGATQTLSLRVKFTVPAQHGLYSCIWNTQEVDNSGNIIQTLAPADTITLSYSNCSLFAIDSLQINNTSCFGSNNGSASIFSLTGGFGSYSYQWSNGNSLANATNLSAGNYYVIVTDLYSGCQDSINFDILDSASLQLVISADSISCYGADDGAIYANVSSGTSALTFLWTNSLNNDSLYSDTISNLAPGTYFYTIADTNNCSSSSSVTINEPAEIIVLQTNTNVLCFGDTSGNTILNISGGDGNYNLNAFQQILYLLGNNTINSTQVFPTGIPAGIYPFSVTDGLGCTIHDTIIITQPISISTINTINNISCYGLADGNVSLSISGGNPPYTENWLGNNPNILSQGIYPYIIVDDNGCQLSDSIIIIEPDSLSYSATINNISCFGLNDGNVAINISGGVAPYSQNWGLSDPLSLTYGMHFFSIIDNNGCSLSDSIFISEPSNIFVSVNNTNVNCFGGSNGTATLSISGGSPPYLENWFGYDNFALTAGTYFYSVSDSNGCIVNDSITITESLDSLTSILTATNLSSCTISDGSISQSIIGGIPPYTYLWNNGDTSKDINGLVAGTYYVTTTDSNGCFTNASIFVDQPSDSLRLNFSTSEFNGFSISCYADSSGSITANTYGGFGLISYYWSTGDSSSALNNLSSGMYSISISDTAGCTLTDSIYLNSPDEFTSTYTSTNVLCFGENSGSASVVFSGGIADYFLSWQGNTHHLLAGQNTFNSGSLTQGIYIYSATDLNGCQLIDTIIIYQPDSLYATNILSNYNGFNISCFGDNDGEVSLNVFGGISPYFIYFNNSQYTGPNPTITGLNQGTFKDSIIDSNGCIYTENITLIEPSRLSATTQLIKNADCYGVCNGSLAVLSGGGIYPHNYIWNNDSTLLSDTVENLCAGTYIVIVEDQNGCQASSLDSISQPININISLDTIINNTVFGGNIGTIYVTLDSSSTNVLFNWTGPNGFSSNTEDIINLSAGTYILIATDSLGCYTDTFIVDQPLSLSASLDYITNNICWGRSHGAIAITPDGGDSIYTYLWTGPNGFSSTDEDIDSLIAGTYTLELSDTTNTITYSFEVLENDAISVYSNSAIADCYDGSAIVTAYGFGGTPPLNTYWSNGDTGNSTILVVGTHAVTVMDVYGCSSTDTLTVDPGDSLSISTSPTMVSCYGLNDAIVSLNVFNGGIPPYQYSNDSGITYQSSNIFYNLSPGINTFTVIDNIGCLNTVSTNLSQPLELGVDVLFTNLECFNDCNATATAIVDNGTQPYSYEWTDPNQQLNQTAIGLCAGTYNVTVTDANGCVATEFVGIANPDPIIINITQNENMLEATLGFVSYQWLDEQLNPLVGDTLNEFFPTQTGEYSVEVLDSNGCTITSYAVSFNYTSISESEIDLLNIYPNPTSSFIYIEEAAKISEIEIFNALGDKVLHHVNEMSANQLKFNLSDKTRGIYFVKVLRGNELISYKIVLQ